MIFLSNLLRESVFDKENHRVGVVRDVCVSLNETFPTVTAIVVHPQQGNTSLYIPWSQVHSIENDSVVYLSVKQAEIIQYEPHVDELLLRRDLLDKQIVDTQGFRVVKVNDLKLAQIKKTARLVGVDISLNGLLRRLGVQPAIDLLSRVMPLQMAERTITWNYVEPIQMTKRVTSELAPTMAGTPVTAGAVSVVPQVQLNVSHTKLADLHPADIADILEQLDLEEAGAMLERLDTETAADTLNEVEYPLQSELLTEMDPEKASDLLEHLAPDDAADILSDIPQAEAERLLNLMPTDESQPIRDLLRYSGETAGGIMTNEVLSLAESATVEEALSYLRQHSTHLEMIYYLYIVDEEKHLKGVVSLRQLVTAEPTITMRELLDPDVITVQIDTDQEEVARIIAKYDLLGVPVVDSDHHLVGLVTVDDVIDVIHEEQAEDLSEIAGTDVEETEEEEHFSWSTAFKRSAWQLVNVVAGFVIAVLFYQIFNPIFTGGLAVASTLGATSFSQTHIALSVILCLTPLLMLVSGNAGSQALNIAGWQLRTKRGRDLWQSLMSELQLGTVGGILISLLVGFGTWIFFHSVPVSIAIGLGIGLTLLVASFGGLILPNVLQRLRLRGSLISAPLLNPVIAILSLGTFLVVTLSLIERLGW